MNVNLKIIKGYTDGELNRFVEEKETFENVSVERAMTLINNNVAEIIDISNSETINTQITELERMVKEKDSIIESKNKETELLQKEIIELEKQIEKLSK